MPGIFDSPEQIAFNERFANSAEITAPVRDELGSLGSHIGIIQWLQRGAPVAAEYQEAATIDHFTDITGLPIVD